MKRKIAALIIAGFMVFQTTAVFAADLTDSYSPANTGNPNEVYQNTNNQNTGTQGAGTQNAGMQNTNTQGISIQGAGTQNTGTQNAGTQNTGTQNAGTQNTGTQNTGTQNTGTQNTDNINQTGGMRSSQQYIIPESLNSRDQNQNGRLNLGTDTYIIQDGDSLWLVMGHIKAKLDVLLYVDPENEKNNAGIGADDKNFFGIPIYR